MHIKIEALIYLSSSRENHYNLIMKEDLKRRLLRKIIDLETS